MGTVNTLRHPLVECHVTTLRDKSTGPLEFRQSISRLSTLLAFSATSGLRTIDIQVETPLQRTAGKQLGDRVGLVPILRAGVGMVEAMLNMIPSAEVWHLGLYRDEATAQPVHYYSKLPPDSPVDLAFVLDPMLATGGSACMACKSLTEWGVRQIKMISIISAPEGIQRLHGEFPQVEIHTCVVDQSLNENKFIVPGLGDAGDRIFNTTNQFRVNRNR
jgi:uracil phosphoribosyltransferase